MKRGWMVFVVVFCLGLAACESEAQTEYRAGVAARNAQIASGVEPVRMNAAEKLALLNLGEPLSRGDDRLEGVALALLAASMQYKVSTEEVAEAVWDTTSSLREQNIDTDAFKVLGVAIDGHVALERNGSSISSLLARYESMRTSGMDHDTVHELTRALAREYKR